MFPLLLQSIISNQMRPRRLRGAWFSRFLRHSTHQARQICMEGRDHAVTETPSSLACTRCAQKNAASEDWPACQWYGQSDGSQQSILLQCSSPTADNGSWMMHEHWAVFMLINCCWSVIHTSWIRCIWMKLSSPHLCSELRSRKLPILLWSFHAWHV